jgi:hypothetical protein
MRHYIGKDEDMSYNSKHYQDVARLLAAEREQNGPSPALNRLTAAFARLFAEDSGRFNRELFGKAARGTVPVTTRPATLRQQHETEHPALAATASTAAWFRESKAAGCTGTRFSSSTDSILHENPGPCPVHPGLPDA